MLCPTCRRQVSRSASVCGACGAPVAGRTPLELVIGDGRRIPLSAGPLSIGRGTDNLIRIEERDGLAAPRTDRRRGGTPLRRGRGLDVRDVRRRAEGRREAHTARRRRRSHGRGRAAGRGATRRPRGRPHGGLWRHPRSARRGRRRAALPAPPRRDEAEAARGRRGRPAVRATRPGRPLRPAERGRCRAAAAARRPDVAREPDHRGRRPLRRRRPERGSPRCSPTWASAACSRASTERRAEAPPKSWLARLFKPREKIVRRARRAGSRRSTARAASSCSRCRRCRDRGACALAGVGVFAVPDRGLR